MSFSPDCKRIASGSDNGTVKVWDAQTGQEVLSLKGHTGNVLRVCFSPDGQRLACACSNGKVVVYDGTPLEKPPVLPQQP